MLVCTGFHQVVWPGCLDIGSTFCSGSLMFLVFFWSCSAWSWEAQRLHSLLDGFHKTGNKIEGLIRLISENKGWAVLVNAHTSCSECDTLKLRKGSVQLTYKDAPRNKARLRRCMLGWSLLCCPERLERKCYWKPFRMRQSYPLRLWF